MANDITRFEKDFPYATVGESYYCRKCKYYWTIGKTDFDKKALVQKICPKCRERRYAMTEQEWKRLELLDQKQEDGKEFDKLMAQTKKEDEHPEWYNGPCMCSLCLSYADI